MKVKAAAKINLMLDILKKLDNGYHSLFMVMQSVGIYDTVTVEKNGEGHIVIECDKKGVPCNSKNIAYKCAEKFYGEYDDGNMWDDADINVELLPEGFSLDDGETLDKPVVSLW